MVLTAVNSGARLDRSPISAFHWRTLIIPSLGWRAMFAVAGAGAPLKGPGAHLVTAEA